MIKITKGTFGYFDGRRIIPTTEADGPQNWDPDLEARLVARGIAEYVGAEPKVEAEPEVEDDSLENKSAKELKAVAESMGLSTKGISKKQDLIALIEGAETVEDGEAPPAFEAADPV